VVFVAAVGVVVTPDRTPQATVEAAVPDTSYCPVDAGLTIGSVGATVGCLQYALALYGFYGGQLTGEYDSATADAVAAYQLAHPPLEPDGLAGTATLEAMGVFSGIDATPLSVCLADAPLLVGSRGPSVDCLQTVLFDRGFLDFPPTSIYDIATSEAVIRAQNEIGGLPIDGVAGQATLAALNIWSGVSTNVAPPPTGQAGDGPWPAPVQDLPFWNTTAEGVPFYGNRRPCTRAQANVIALQFARDGADDATQQWAAYVASREGGCDHTTVNLNYDTRDDSHCTFQLNALAGMFNPSAQLGRRGWNVTNVKESLDNCADAASDLWVFCGRGPWSPPAYGCQPPWENDLGPEGDA
jgi:peptidoglycan hydrolase-like protein with peptidoglycan-binding domain